MDLKISRDMHEDAKVYIPARPDHYGECRIIFQMRGKFLYSLDYKIAKKTAQDYLQKKGWADLEGIVIDIAPLIRAGLIPADKLEEIKD